MNFRIIFIIILSLFMSGNGASTEATEFSQKVLIVQSYNREDESVSVISRGIKRVFENKKNVQVETIYMDAKRNPSPEWKEKAAETVIEAIDLWKPQVVVLVNDIAQEYVGKRYINKSSPYIVYCGVNKPIEFYKDASNICGVLGRPHFTKTIEFFKRINPKLKTVAVLSDNSTASEAVVEYIKEEAKKIEDISFIGFDTPVTFPEWKTLVAEYEKTADAIVVYSYSNLKTADAEKLIPSRKVMRWMRRKSIVPVLGLRSFSVDDGALFGVLESVLEDGKDAAFMANELLEGKKPSDFKDHVVREGIVVLDMVQLTERGLAIDDSLKDEIDIILGD